MNQKVLVTYASKYGATAGIAEKIADVLRGAGLQVDLKPVKEARDLSPYGAVVLGSAVYIGAWQKDAEKFIKKNKQALSKMPVWIFSSGPTGEGDPVELLQGWTFPEKLKPIADLINPQGVTVFHGAIDAQKLNFFLRWMLRNVDGAFGDFRDWDAIDAWALEIGESLNATDRPLGHVEGT